MTHENVTIVDKDIRSAYREIFGEVLQEYNSRQKRSDRKIDDYYEHILKSKNGEKPFYEDVLQWGRMEDFRAEPQLREKAKECLVEYARTFEARNPNLKLIGAYVHMDEASPHLHLDYIPVAKGYKTGLQARNSLDKAMKQMGYTPVKESRKNNATKLWKENEREYFGELCRSKGLKVEAERSLGRKQFTVSEFKEAQNEMLEEIKADMLPVIENYNTRKDEALNAAIQAKGKAQAEKRFLGYAGGDDGTGNASFLFRRRRRNSPKNPEVKGCEGWRFAIANTTPSLDFWIAWYALRGRRPTCSRGRPPRRSLRSIKKPALPSVKLTRRADSRIMALVVGTLIPDHEYMRVKLTYSP